MINQMLMIVAVVLVADVIALDNNQQTGVVCSAEDDNLTNTIILNLLEGVGDPEDDCECSWTRQTVFECWSEDKENHPIPSRPTYSSE